MEQQPVIASCFAQDNVTYKHPVLVGREEEIAHTLADPDEMRRSRKDPNVLLFYRGTVPRW